MNTKKPSKTNQHSYSFLKSWLPTFLWILFVCYLSLADSGLPEIKFSFFVESDKIAHAGIYFIFVFLLTRSWVHHFANKAVLFLIISSFMQTISFGIVMEVLQKLLTQSREFDMNDIYANTGGTVAGLFFYYLMYRFGFQATSDKLTQ